MKRRVTASAPRADFFFFPGRVVGLDIVVENLDELGDDLVAFEGGEQAAVHVDGSVRFFDRPRQKDSEDGYGLPFFPESRVLISLLILAPFLVS